MMKNIYDETMMNHTVDDSFKIKTKKMEVKWINLKIFS